MWTRAQSTFGKSVLRFTSNQPSTGRSAASRSSGSPPAPLRDAPRTACDRTRRRRQHDRHSEPVSNDELATRKDAAAGAAHRSQAARLNRSTRPRSGQTFRAREHPRQPVSPARARQHDAKQTSSTPMLPCSAIANCFTRDQEDIPPGRSRRRSSRSCARHSCAPGRIMVQPPCISISTNAIFAAR